jgi:cobalt-zinc-cadmium efflux system outer membrane protein
MRKQFVALSLACANIASPVFGNPDRQPRETKSNQLAQANPAIPSNAAGSALTLESLQQIATQNNPTLKQAEANVQASRGRANQAGLLPNPVVGYQGEEFAFRFFDKKSEHFGFVEQTIPLGGKLGKDLLG